jgi:hypothetical protein
MLPLPTARIELLISGQIMMALLQPFAYNWKQTDFAAGKIEAGVLLVST